MHIEEQDNWLFIRLEDSEINPDLGWNELVKWKIPESERVYIAEIDTWIIRHKHLQLINTLHCIYHILTRPDPPMEALQQINQMLESIEKWYPVRKGMRKKLREFVGFKMERIEKN